MRTNKTPKTTEASTHKLTAKASLSIRTNFYDESTGHVDAPSNEEEARESALAGLRWLTGLLGLIAVIDGHAAKQQNLEELLGDVGELGRELASATYSAVASIGDPNFR